MSRECAKELGLLVQAGWRLIAARDRSRRSARSRRSQLAAKACGRELIPWSVASGLGRRRNRRGLVRRRAARDLGRSRSRRSSRCSTRIASSTIRSRCAACATCCEMLAERKQAIVLVAPALDLPVELVHEAGVVELPLPRRRGARRRLQARDRGAADPVALDGACAPRSASPPTRRCASSARPAARGRTRTRRRSPAIVREKRQALRRTPALSFQRVERRARRRRRARRAQALAARAPPRLRRRGAALRAAAAARPAAARRAGLRQVALRQGRRARVELPAAPARPRRRLRRRRARRPRRRSARRPRSPSRSRRACSGSTRSRRASPPPSEGGASSRVFGAFLTWLSEKQAPVFVVATANDVTAPAAGAAAPRAASTICSSSTCRRSAERVEILGDPPAQARPRSAAVRPRGARARRPSGSPAPSSSRW